MRAFTPGFRLTRLALTAAGLAVLIAAPAASAGSLAPHGRAAAYAPPAHLIQRVDDRGWSRSPSRPWPDQDYGAPGRGQQPFNAPPANWQADRYSPSMYDKRDAANWGAAAAAGAVGLDAIDNWAWRNSGPFPGAGDPDGPAPAPASPDEIAPPQARPGPGPNSIGSPSPTQTQASGCYTLGADLICPNN